MDSGVGSGEVVVTISLGSGEREISWRGVWFIACCSADQVLEGIDCEWVRGMFALFESVSSFVLREEF